MRLGIEVGQLFPQRSGGIVQLLRGVCGALFRLDPESRFFIYRAVDNISLAEFTSHNASVIELDREAFWEDLTIAAARDGLDVLLRTYPIEHPIGFPLERQIVLVPDLQHEVLPECFRAEDLMRRRQAFGPLIRGAGAIAVLAEHGRAILRDRYPDAKGEVFLLPPASSLGESAAGHEALPAGIEAIVSAAPFFLYPANLWPHKNHRRLFQALAQFNADRARPVSLILVGDSSGWEELQEHCRGLPVHHLGFVPPATLAKLYRRCLAVTFFSLFEGFGIPLVEAFQFGVPVLCSTSSSLPEIGGDAVLTCDPTDVTAMAHLMRRIANDSQLRDDLVRRGLARQDLYTWEGSARGLWDACHRLVNRPLSFPPVAAALGLLAQKVESYRHVSRERQESITSLSHEAAARARIISQLHEVIAELRGNLADQAAGNAELLRVNAVLHQALADQNQHLQSVNANLQGVQAELEQTRGTLEHAWSCLPFRLVRSLRNRQRRAG